MAFNALSRAAFASRRINQFGMFSVLEANVQKILVRNVGYGNPGTSVRKDPGGRADPIELNEFRSTEVTIRVPLKWEKRLTKKMSIEQSRAFQKAQLVEKSRGGSKIAPVITAKKPTLNHYKGQSYASKDEIPLASKGWLSKKSYGDYFTVHPVDDSSAFMELEGRETFEQLGLRSAVVQAAESLGFEKPTIAQMTAIPQILKGGHNIVAAETGCGKTLAYLLPLVDQVLLQRRARLGRPPNQPYAIILLPTRELVDQVYNVAFTLSKRVGLTLRLLQGGNLESKLRNPSTKPVDILISSINIISTMSAMDAFDISKVFHIVLDEADTLLDDSFNQTVVSFLGRFPLIPRRDNFRPMQLTLVSATMPRSVEQILEEVVPVDQIRRVTTPGLHRIAKSVPQVFRRVRKMDKPKIIVDYANHAMETKEPLIIFVNKTDTCKWLEAHITRNGIECVALFSEIRPSVRRERMDMFMNGEVFVLICTDIGSRGIDTINTKHVVNYEFPRFLADYVHRSGRVGRVGSVEGCNVTNLISGGNEVEMVQQIELSVRKDESLTRVNANIKRLLNAKYGMYKPIEPISEEEEAEEKRRM